MTKFSKNPQKKKKKEYGKTALLSGFLLYI